ncbi:MAG: histidine--tRNA ligase [Ruminococcus sp.]|jgi:histidyl-tRNA synthetase|nr:histidine--tRNA ligase [Ruminococcus sp.]
MNYKKPTGTADVLPSDVVKWKTVETLALDTAKNFGFSEIRVPTFEDAGLYLRSVGDTTDIVQKEMYYVFAKENKNERTSANNSETKNKENFALRPEGTAGVIRAVIQNGLLGNAMPLRVCYVLSCFRHEKPQAGRLREFHQFGLEMAGSSSSFADAEVISVAKAILDNLQIKNAELNINSIGCPECRAEYKKALTNFFESENDNLCPTCQNRLHTNPMRILDCKSNVCKELAKGAPVILDYLCTDCKEHFEELKDNLDTLEIEYKINPKIVRGLDYYTRTVFEFISNDIGSQSTICGGGRYDGLIEELGGSAAPALGFAMGLERLIMVMERQGCEFFEKPKPDVYIAVADKAAKKQAYKLTNELRNNGFYAETDVMGRSLRAQMKYADKINAENVIVLGGSEIESRKVVIKNMNGAGEKTVSLDEVVDAFTGD